MLVIAAGPERARSARAPGGAEGSRRRGAPGLCRSRLGFPLAAQYLARGARRPRRAAARNALRRFCKANFLSLVAHARMARHLSPARRRGGRRRAGTPERRERRAKRSYDRASIAPCSPGCSARSRSARSAISTRRPATALVTLFPGSNLYERRDKPKKGARPAKPGGQDAAQPPWIVAGEIVETSQLFARTVAGINPEWVIELGAHLCQYRYTEPHWSAKAGRVLVLERVLVHGLEVARRQVDYGRIDPVEGHGAVHPRRAGGGGGAHPAPFLRAKTARCATRSRPR